MSFHPPLDLKQSYTAASPSNAHCADKDDKSSTTNLDEQTPEAAASIVDDPCVINPKYDTNQSVLSLHEQHSSNASSSSHTTSSSSSSSSSSDSDSDSDDENIPMFELLMKMQGISEDIEFKNNGYCKIQKLNDTPQGSIIDAVRVSDKKSVWIKKTDKELAAEGVTFAMDGDYHFTVNDNVEKEAKILQLLSHSANNDFVIKYIDYWEGSEALYLVTESLAEENWTTDLAQFITHSHALINEGKLSKKDFNKVVKYIAWQMLTILHWLHADMRCCHLNLNAKTIKLKNADYIEESNGHLIINPHIAIKITDFSKAEVFSDDNFLCNNHLFASDSGVQYFSPKKNEDTVYDAKAADMWSLGQILYLAIVGEPLYQSIYEDAHFEAIEKLKQDKRFNGKKLSLITNLLEIDEGKRISSSQLLQHKWFTAYWSKFKRDIQRTSKNQKEKLDEIAETLKGFPYYKLPVH